MIERVAQRVGMASFIKAASHDSRFHRPLSLLPGLGLCVLVSLLAALGGEFQFWLFGRVWLEALVLAILIGTVLRSCVAPPARFEPGIAVSAKLLLEVAVMLLGATVSGRALLGVGAPLLCGIALIVVLAIASSFAIGRAFGLPPRMATLVAAGNAICGNSAIAAVAPAIGAEAGEVAAAIAFTAVLGVLVVLGLPLLAVAAHLSPHRFGILAGLTVYAVPQVLAATAPISSLSAQIGMLVKLVRVLMLGPVVMLLSLLYRGRTDAARASSSGLPPATMLVPWFIVGFLLLLGVRSAGLLPPVLLLPIGRIAGWLTVMSMAGLGLGVDIRSLARAGGAVAATVSLSLLVLGALAWLLIMVLGG